MTDPWAAHRAAISIEEGGSVVHALGELLRCHDNDMENVISFLTWHGLCGLWSEALLAHRGASKNDGWHHDAALNGLHDRLSNLQRQQFAHQLLQDAVMKPASRALDQASVPYVWLKAAAVRGELYPRPGLRPSTDLDLLVAPIDRERAVRALVSVGAVCVGPESFSSHEQVLRHGSVDLDLHWHVLAPGRLRPGVTEDILRDRVVTASGARPSHSHLLALALIHPAFAKHVCSRYMGLNRVADTLRMLRLWSIEVEELIQVTKRWGGFTAAKASIYWLSKISEMVRLSQLNMAFNREASKARDKFLARRIDQNWPDQWVDRSTAILGLTFSVWLQDSPSDALRAVWARGARARHSMTKASALL